MATTSPEPRSTNNDRHANPKQWLLHKLSKKHSILPLRAPKSTAQQDESFNEEANTLQLDTSSSSSSPDLSHLQFLQQQDGDLGILYQYLVSHNNNANNADVVRDMQDYIARKQALFNAVSEASSMISPTHSRQSSCGTIASRVTLSDMSDERIDEWLEKPEDAEVHRYRKASEASAAVEEEVIG